MKIFTPDTSSGSQPIVSSTPPQCILYPSYRNISTTANARINGGIKMKSTYMFRDQVNQVTNWFKLWNECEQTVALYSLLKKVAPTQAKFLLQVLQQSVKDCSQVQLMENEANNPVFIRSLCNETKENAVQCLLSHLPLLRPGNTEAKTEYLKLIPKILDDSIERGSEIEESRQLLSYSLIHPAINSDERNQLNLWLGQLEERATSFSIYQQSRLNQADLTDLSHAMAYMDNHPQVAVNGGGGSNYTSASHPPQLAPPSGVNGWQSAPRDLMVSDPELHATITSCSTSAVGRPIKAATTSVCHGNGNVMVNSTSLIPHHTPLHATNSGPPAYNSSSHQGGQMNAHRKLTRSLSVTPPISVVPSLNVSDWLNSQDNLLRDGRLSINNNNNQQQLPNSNVMDPPHAPLSPQSSVTSSGSGSDTQQHGDDHVPIMHPQNRNTFLEEASGMKDVPIWLKSLRLHKYAYLFQQMTYDDMMSITESWLELQNVTKGARHKIVLSINKLRERQNLLRAMEKEIMESGNIKQALTEIKGILNTPLKMTTPPPTPLSPLSSNGQNLVHPPPNNGEGDAIPEGDLPGQLTRVLGKVCTQLLVSWSPDDESFAMYVQLLDKCMAHEAFTSKAKKLLSSWRQQIYKIWHPTPQKYNMDKTRRLVYDQTNIFGSTFPMPGGVIRQRPLQPRTIVKPGTAPQWAFNQQPPMGPPLTAANLPLYRNNSINNTYGARPQLFDVNMLKQQVQRTHSAPIKSSQFGVNIPSRPVSDLNVTETQINARLDSLCLRMTEAALGNFGE